jgi:hypothetical protein
MPNFTIKTMYRLPVFRHRTYEAGTVEEACRLAQTDADWSGSKPDHECAGEIFVSEIWADADYTVPSARVPSQFGESVHRKAEHFEILLGVLKVLLAVESQPPAKRSFWQQRGGKAVAKAESILAGEPDPLSHGFTPCPSTRPALPGFFMSGGMTSKAGSRAFATVAMRSRDELGP